MTPQNDKKRILPSSFVILLMPPECIQFPIIPPVPVIPRNPFSVIAKSVPFSVIPRIVFSCHSERSEESPPLCLYNSTKCIQKDTFNQNKNP